MLSKTLTFLGMASAATAHMVMTNPVPYGNPNNSPLEATGADFPCKGASPDGSVGQNVYKAGSTQALTFQGGATHGGGSCQVSVTTDLNPTRDSEWKVIKSIEGGCPARGEVGNIGTDASAADPYEYDFEIPKEMPEGEYVLAWTWFNKVGNREMYMNCASVQITGGSGDDSFLASLPDMFVANVGDGCGTVGDKDVKFPNPGSVVERLNGATDAFADPTGSCAAPVGGGNGGASPSQPEPTTAPSSVPEDPAPTSVPVSTSASIPTGPKPTPTIPGGVFITVPTTAPVAPTATLEPEQPTQPEEPAEPEQPQPEESTTPEPEVPSPGSGSGSGSQAAGSPCTTEGTWNCVGGSSFQRCASGVWSQVMNLAQGTSCDEGQSEALSVHASAAKRHMRRAQRIRY
ncbi:uncharacterized protein F5Z01DRAFT_335500 [Emericellopsis atlantica]|uniref:Auxiliary Activity family 9 catalytic domain-containing protein n=1 Tax=Emericellopsis atlantica TaxID=2614577 RepID=A0A9P8CKT0_9HYPO|nr:uncharacterized protein F5Z01DRAFT_335500 [Emericellopsis atlantica]KAG9250889.1 hypothetical protein F5Z01DRAFT_335500 [Emericellopsis atlantica]